MQIVANRRYVFKVGDKTYYGKGTTVEKQPPFIPFIDVIQCYHSDLKVLPQCPPEKTVVWFNINTIEMIAEIPQCN